MHQGKFDDAESLLLEALSKVGEVARGEGGEVAMLRPVSTGQQQPRDLGESGGGLPAPQQATRGELLGLCQCPTSSLPHCRWPLATSLS